MLSISYPLIMINFLPEPNLSIIDLIGGGVFLIGFEFEAIGDYQLAKFIKYRKGEGNRIMTDGLWKYTRHPNYFGEALLWWGIFLFAIPVKNPGLCSFTKEDPALK